MNTHPQSGPHDGEPAPGVVPQHVWQRLASVGVELRTTTAVTRTSGTITFTATLAGQTVHITALTSDNPQAQRRHIAEQDLYRIAASQDCPLPIPRLLHADDTITITDHTGQPLHPGRYPGPLQQDTVLALLDQLDDLHRWRPAGLPHRPITGTDISRHQTSGLLKAVDRSAIAAFLHGSAPPRVEYGDPHPAGIWIDGPKVTVIDPRPLAYHLPGRNWALIQLLWAPANPWLHEHITRRVEQHRIRGAHAVNLMLAACDEWTNHRPRADPHLKPLLDANLTMARRHLRTLYEVSW